ncbi:hypothetical protein BD413DRAFT_526275 [Trametes elegans]|nr:hypothetical protein BD413DRAFT_526275 [Trametes elegans]
MNMTRADREGAGVGDSACAEGEGGEGGSGARCGERRRGGLDRWEDRHEAEREGPGQGAHRPPPPLSPRRPTPSPDRPPVLSAPRSEPHHRPRRTTSTSPSPASPSSASAARPAQSASGSPPSRVCLLPPPSPPRPENARMNPRDLLPLLHCPLCPPSSLLRAPVTLHCGHTFCAAHLASRDAPSTSKASDNVPMLPQCPLPTCSSPSRAPTAFANAPPLDVSVNKILELLVAGETDETPPSPPPPHNPEECTDSEYEVDSDSDLDYLPLRPQSPASIGSHPASPPTRRAESAHRPSRSSPTQADRGHRSRSRSQPSPRLHPRKRRRRSHRHKELLTELTCEICFGLFWQPVTTPCQHTFCTRCLFRSLDHGQLCPLCRQKLPGYDYFQQHPCNKVILAIILQAFPDDYAERGAAIETEERDARLDTPVFVCQLSFPGMPTMLHFFEPRYRLMLRRCLDSPHPCFGMIPPPRSAPSSSAGASSTGNDYGTMLAIRNVQMLPDGRSIVETWGTWRFRIMERGTLDGYMVARVERIEDYQEELDGSATASEDVRGEDHADGDTMGRGRGQSEAEQHPDQPPVEGGQSQVARTEEQAEASLRAELQDSGARPTSSSASPSRPGAIHASPPPPERAGRPRARREGAETSREGKASEPGDMAQGDAVAVPASVPTARAPTNAELIARCHAFIEQMREGTPWVVQHLNNNYVPMPSDPASFSFWMALLLPIDEHEKAKLLPIRSPRLRLRLVVHWIEQLNSNWWFSGGCVVC